MNYDLIAESFEQIACVLSVDLTQKPGSCYSSETKDIRKAMHLADERMYDIKQEYYKRHPESAWDRYHS